MEFLEEELQVLDMSEKIRTKVKSDIDDQQREFYLRQQIKAIQEELAMMQSNRRSINFVTN